MNWLQKELALTIVLLLIHITTNAPVYTDDPFYMLDDIEWGLGDDTGNGVAPQGLLHKMRHIEKKLEEKMDENAKKLNYSVDISHLLKLFHMVNEEVTMQWAKIKDIQERMAEMERYMGGTMPPPSATTTIAVPNRITEYPIDCQDAYERGSLQQGAAANIPLTTLLSTTPFIARCEVKDNTGWTVIQRRLDGSVDFFRDWQDYKEGFGDLGTEFWIGLDKMYQLTNQQPMKLRIEMRDWDGNDYWAEYDHFRVADEADHFRLHVHGYRGNSGDSMTQIGVSHDGQPFSTKDKDNDERYHNNCAFHYRGAWWFRSCFESHLNGIYYQKGPHNDFFVRNGIQWNTIHIHSSLQSVQMMLAPNADLEHGAK